MVPSAKSEIRVRFDLLCEKLGIEPRIRAEVDDMATLRCWRVMPVRWR
jgi:LysR family transcriptional activator of nhaA